MRLYTTELMTSNETRGVRVGVIAHSGYMRVSKRTKAHAGPLYFERLEQSPKQQADGIGFSLHPCVSVCGEKREFIAALHDFDCLDSFRPKHRHSSNAGFLPVIVDHRKTLVLSDIRMPKLRNVCGVHATVQTEQHEGAQWAADVGQYLSDFLRGEFALSVLGYVLTPHLAFFCRAGLLEGVSIPRLAISQTGGGCGPFEHCADGLNPVVELPRPEFLSPLGAGAFEITWSEIRYASELADNGQELVDRLFVVVPGLGLNLVLSIGAELVSDLADGWVSRHRRDMAHGNASIAPADDLNQLIPGGCLIRPDAQSPVYTFAHATIGSVGEVEGEAPHATGNDNGMAFGPKTVVRKVVKSVFSDFGKSAVNTEISGNSSDRTRTCDPRLMKSLAGSAGNEASGVSGEIRYSTPRRWGRFWPKSCQRVVSLNTAKGVTL